MLKAIYSGDALHELASVFTLNEGSGHFEHEDLSYPFVIVMNDPGWQVYVVSGDLSYPIKNLNPSSDEEISAVLEIDRLTAKEVDRPPALTNEELLEEILLFEEEFYDSYDLQKDIQPAYNVFCQTADARPSLSFHEKTRANLEEYLKQARAHYASFEEHELLNTCSQISDAFDPFTRTFCRKHPETAGGRND